MPGKLPSWVVSNAESVRREVEPYREMAIGQRLEVLARVCRDAVQLASIGGATRERAVRAWQDPLPESSIRALARIRAQYRREHPEEFAT